MFPMTNRDEAIAAFHDFVRDRGFPCVGAKSALATDGLTILVAEDLRCGADDGAILAALRAALPDPDPARLISIVVLFPSTPAMGEAAFEAGMWRRLQALHEVDRIDFDWDPRVSADPTSPDFGMSLGGAGYFVVGMHPGASRLARRAPVATLAFNPHAQFRRLKAEGRYGRLSEVVRGRDTAFQGTPNPMLSDHGTVSEAVQYSGRAVSEDWVCPFRAQSGLRYGA